MISIIIPALNEEKVIKDTIAQFSALDSSSAPFDYEIIVSDGGSTDMTVAIAKEKLASFISGSKALNKVIVFPKDRKQTIAANRNNGARVAQGEFLVFVDSGALLHNPQVFMRKALEHFVRNSQLVGLTVSIKVFPNVASFMDKVVFGTMNVAFTILNNGFNRGTSQGKFQMVRRETFEKIGGYREDLPAAEDTDLFYRLSRIGKTRVDPKLVIYHGSRRAHALGWPKLLFLWYIDATSLFFFNKVISKEWKVIR